MSKKRFVNKTINDEQENVCQSECTKHRSFDNFFNASICCAYAWEKTSITIEIINKSKLIT